MLQLLLLMFVWRRRDWKLLHLFLWKLRISGKKIWWHQLAISTLKASIIIPFNQQNIEYTLFFCVDIPFVRLFDSQIVCLYSFFFLAAFSKCDSAVSGVRVKIWNCFSSVFVVVVVVLSVRLLAFRLLLLLLNFVESWTETTKLSNSRNMFAFYFWFYDLIQTVFNWMLNWRVVVFFFSVVVFCFSIRQSFSS